MKLLSNFTKISLWDLNIQINLKSIELCLTVEKYLTNVFRLYICLKKPYRNFAWNLSEKTFLLIVLRRVFQYMKENS